MLDEGDGREGEPTPPPGRAAQHLAPPAPLPHRIRRPARRIAGFAAGLVLVGGATYAVVGPQQPSGQSRPPAATSTHADRAPAAARTLDPQVAVAQVLRQRAAAALGGDRDAWMATVDPRSGSFRSGQADLFDRLAKLPISRWSYRITDAGGDAAGSGPARRTVEVRLSYRLEPDGKDTQRRQTLTVQRRQDRWVLTADDDGPTDRDLWDLGPIAVETGRRTLVVGHASQRGALDRYVTETEQAIDRVSAVWGKQWPRKVVILVPRDVKQMATVLGRRSTAGLGRLAAVTTGVVEHTGDGRSADRIVINPKAFASFTGLGRRIVLTHETTHVATRSAGTVTSPLWLDEGFADYIGFRGSGLSPSAVARSLLADVRQGRGPSRLPGADDFDPTKGDVDAAYEGSWLAIELIGRDSGRSKVVRFYRAAIGAGAGPAGSEAAASQAALNRAFLEVLGTDQRRFERRWRGYLNELARQAA